MYGTVGSLYCKPETNIALYVKYRIKKKKKELVDTTKKIKNKIYLFHQLYFI